MRERILAVLLPLAAACAAPAAKAKPDGTAERRSLACSIRLVYQGTGGEGPGHWVGQTSVRTLRNPETGATVTLLSMQHYGLPGYYRDLEVHLRDADIVLAEGWRDPSSGEPLQDDDLPKEGLWIRRQHRMIDRLLELESQQEWEDRVVDRRWVSADMDMGELVEEMDARKVELLGADAKARVERLEALVAGSPTPEELADARRRLEGSIMHAIESGDGPTGPELEIQLQREEAMWRIVKERLASGKYRRAVLVYGAWHTPALEERLVNELGFRVEGTCWHDAAVFEQPAGQP